MTGRFHGCVHITFINGKFANDLRKVSVLPKSLTSHHDSSADTDATVYKAHPTAFVSATLSNFLQLPSSMSSYSAPSIWSVSCARSPKRPGKPWPFLNLAWCFFSVQAISTHGNGLV